MPETNTVAPPGLTAPARQHAPRSKLAHSCRPDVVCGLVTTAVLGLADDTPADEGTRTAAGEQDAQHQARHSATTAAPATLAACRRIVTLTDRPFPSRAPEPPAARRRSHYPT